MDERIYFVLGLVSGLAAFGLALFLWRVVFTKGLLEPHQSAALLIMGLAVAVVAGQMASTTISPSSRPRGATSTLRCCPSPCSSSWDCGS